MNAIAASLVPAIGWALIDFLWQGALIAALAALALALLRGARPQARYLVCAIALATCVAIPALQVARGMHAQASGDAFVSINVAHAATIITNAVVAAPQQVWQSALQQKLPWIVALWALGAGLFALRMSAGLLWVRWLGRRQPYAIDRGWQGRLDDLADAMGLNRDVGLRILDASVALTSPIAVGIVKPLVLVPAAVFAHLPAELLEALLAHELAHVRRHDYLVNLIQGAVEALLFYHPVVWWLSRRMRVEREQIADDLAARVIGEPRRLAFALDALDRSQCESLVLSPSLPAANGGHLMSRIQRLLQLDPNPSRRHAMSWLMALPILGLTAICLTVYAHGQTAPSQAHAASSPHAAAPVGADTAKAPSVQASADTDMDDDDAADTGNTGNDNDEDDNNAADTDDTDATQVEPADKTHASVHNAHVHVATTHGSDRHHGDSYAVVHEGKDGISMSGDSADMARIEHARQHVHGDFIWARHDGKEYIVQDPEVIARAEAAWTAAEAIGKQMDALGKQMDVPGKRMEELGRQMEALEAGRHPDDEAMEKSGGQMGELGREQGAIATEMAGLELQMQGADRAQREELRAKLEAVRARMEPLKEHMKLLAVQMEQRGHEMEKVREPMEVLAKQMAAEREPMEALGRQMEALGKQEEQASHEADRAMRDQIDRAIRDGKAAPVHEQAPN